ncbi:TonB-dependent receptor plug domain-containing protein [Roseateles sp. So40a]|uniref:TonB-dependent receptor plug domain-containing protein n=1 Tax=Roseateles sp. So40a TaxID=3400226 RepID=UPI003A8BC329
MHHRSKIALAATLALGSLAGEAALAQQAQPTQIERVEITGTRIRQVDAETAQPVLKVTAEDIQKSGLTTVGDIVNALASAGSPDFSKGAVLTSNREQGGQYINLRNLGSLRLLVLVNGKRWTQTVGGYSDVSTIPASMIERVEVLKDGASSIYGSDAIAGVVNFILKKSMTGANASVYYGENSKGDGKTEAGSFTVGAGDDKASIMVGFNYNKQGTVWAKDRPETATTYGPEAPTASLGLGPWGRYRVLNAAGAPTGSTFVLNHTGSYMGDGTGTDSRNPANYHVGATTADNFNSTSQMMFTSPTEQKSIFTKAGIDLSDAVRFNTTAMYSDRSSTRQVAGYPLQSTTQASYPVYIDKDSYYNPLGSSVVGAGNGQNLFFQRRTIEVPRVTSSNNKTYHMDGSLEGDVTILGKAWNWNVGYNYNKTGGTFLSTGNINLLNLKKALGPSFKNANGVVQCGTAAAPIALVDCTPFDILGGPSASTADALNYIMSTGQGTFGSVVKSATADFGGELFNLPAGAVGLAGGFEHRKVSGYDRPGQFEQSGYSTDLAAKSTSGKYSVKEAYVELNVPLLKNLPAIELLSINLASRYSDYSNFGDTTNSKFSFMWKPVRDLLARGTIAEGFRAPTLSDTFGGGSQTFDTILDPCDTVYGAAKDASATAIRARCAAAGAGGNFRQLNQSGSPITATGGAQGLSAFQSGAGNSALMPETSLSKTAGLVYSPSFVNGLTLTLDWYDVRIKDRITAVSANYILGQCYTQGVQSFCSSLKRDPSTGQLTNLARGNANLGQLQVSGWDFGVAYRLPKTSFGQFSVKSDFSYTDKYKIKSTNDATSRWIDYGDEYPVYPVKGNVQVDWSMAQWSATWTARYYGATKSTCGATDNQCNRPDGYFQGTEGAGYNRLGTQIFHDISVGLKTPWKGQLLVGINNAFKKKPRFNGDADASASLVDPDLPIDRFFWVRYNQSF